MNKSRRDDLERSVNSWQQSVDHDRGQARLSLVIFGGGSALLGAGVISLIAGAPEAAVFAFAVGGGMTAIGEDSLRADIDMGMKAQATLAVRQHELEELENTQ